MPSTLRLALFVALAGLVALGCAGKKNCSELHWSCGVDDFDQSCGFCGGNQACSGGICTTAPTQPPCHCDGRACGIDNCGNSCGTCAAPLVCMNGSYCGMPPVSLWRVTVTSGTVAERDPSGAAWDLFGGLPDPFVCLSAGGNTKCTRAIGDTLMPTWNEWLLTVSPEALQAGLSVQYWDADIDANDLICSEVFAIRQQDLARGSARLGCPSNGPDSFVVQFTPQPSW